MSRRNNDKKMFETNNLLLLAMDFSYQAMDEKEVESIDRTDMFLRECISIIKNKEVLNVNINGKVAHGKSTVGIAICNFVSKICYGHEMNVHQLARDQEEFMSLQKNPQVKNTCIVIDEWNQLEDTGENSSVEKALMTYMSDVQAQRFIHKISCSPSSAPDKNADIYLEVIQPDKKEKITHCRLIYRFMKAGMPITQILGHVNIDVSEALELKWYEEYRRRKFEKMGLILNEGIFRPREMDYAQIILNVIDRLRGLCRETNVTQPMVRVAVESEFRRNKIVTSIPGAMLATERVYGVLQNWKAYFRMVKEIDHMYRKAGKMSEKNPEHVEDDVYYLKIDNMKKNAQMMAEQAAAAEEGFKRMVEIKKKYDTIQVGSEEEDDEKKNSK